MPTATQLTAEVNIHLEDIVSTKLSDVSIKSNIQGNDAIVKHLITESNVQMRKRWCHEYKTWALDVNKSVKWQDDWLSYIMFPAER
jgi:hypothetical protein